VQEEYEVSPMASIENHAHERESVLTPTSVCALIITLNAFKGFIAEGYVGEV
jgi:hypothetical protein